MTRFTLDQAGLITANSHALRDVAVNAAAQNLHDPR